MLFEHKSRQKYLEAIQRHGLLRYNSFERRETLVVLLFVYITGEKFSKEINREGRVTEFPMGHATQKSNWNHFIKSTIDEAIIFSFFFNYAKDLVQKSTHFMGKCHNKQGRAT